MKISLAIAPENALPSAFVVFRDKLEVSIKKVAKLGYDGVELALLDKEQVDVRNIKRLLKDYNLELPTISTGQIYGESRLCFTAPQKAIRDKAINKLKGIMEVASEFESKVNIGRVRGSYNEGFSRQETEKYFISAMKSLSDYGKRLGVELILEPVNRYEINFINSCEEGFDFIKQLGKDNIKLMPDLFHMNIEEPSIEGSLIKYNNVISYIHVADTNRYAPGRGHMDFESIILALAAVNYQDYLSIEILQYPEPDIAAREAIEYLWKYM